MTDLKSIVGGAVVGRARETRECFCRAPEVSREVCAKILRNLLDLFSILAGELVVVSFPRISPSLKGLGTQHDASNYVVDRSRARLLAHERELILELNVVRAESTELKTFLDSSAARVCPFGRQIDDLKTDQARRV